MPLCSSPERAGGDCGWRSIVLGALIGAGGYGQPILTGIRLDNISLILEGAVPAALLALFVQAFFDLIEKLLVRH